MKKFLYKLSNLILGLFGIAAVLGLAYTMFPEYFAFIFNALGMSEEHIAMATVVLSGITVFGGMSKYLGGVLRASQTLSEQQNTITLRRMDEKHNEEIQRIRSEKNEETKIYSGIINELIDKQNENNTLLNQILEVQAITARRNANSNSNLITDEDKHLYKEFLKGLSNGESNIKVENLFTTLTVIEEKEKEEQENKDALEQRL